MLRQLSPGAAQGMALHRAVMLVKQALVNEVEAALDPYLVSFARYSVLSYLSFAPGKGTASVGRIAESLGVHPSSITKATDRLAVDGLIIKHVHPGDARTVMAKITPAGRAVTRKATHALGEVFERQPLSGDDIATFVALCDKIRLGLESPPEAD